MSDYCRYNGGGNSSFLAFVMGAAIGGGLALLFAPRSGEETRKKATEMADDVREKVRSIIDEAEERIKETIEEGRDALEEKKDVIASAISAGKQAYEEGRKQAEKSPQN